MFIHLTFDLIGRFSLTVVISMAILRGPKGAFVSGKEAAIAEFRILKPGVVKRATFVLGARRDPLKDRHRLSKKSPAEGKASAIDVDYFFSVRIYRKHHLRDDRAGVNPFHNLVNRHSVELFTLLHCPIDG